MAELKTNRCSHCGVDVDAALEKCPLCSTPLTDTPLPNGLYAPADTPARPSRRGFYEDLFIFLSVVFIVGAIILTALTWNGVPWFLAVAATVLYTWITLRTFSSRYLFGTKVLLQVVGLTLLILTFYFVAGRTLWAVNYLLPFIPLGANVAIDIYAYTYKTRWKPNLLYALLFAALGFIPLILYFTGVSSAFLPMFLAAVSSTLSILGMLRFALRVLLLELKKRFHM